MSKPACIYLIRHATPDWSRKDIPYDIPPGPPLTAEGEREALALGAFLKQAGVAMVYHSPMERALRTAQIAAGVAGVEMLLRDDLSEWRSKEKDEDVHARVWRVAQECLTQSEAGRPVGLVTHGGPIGLLLCEFKLPAGQLDAQRRLYDHGNPLPPAGAWLVRACQDGWELELAFKPGG
jgi:broad specificity phosphatase PhoE